MAKRAKQHPDLQAIPLLKLEPLYIGIDRGKVRQVAGFCLNNPLRALSAI
jgi:hypothetical protein